VQPSLDIGSIDETGITFTDNPFTKAARNAQLRKATGATTTQQSRDVRASHGSTQASKQSATPGFQSVAPVQQGHKTSQPPASTSATVPPSYQQTRIERRTEPKGSPTARACQSSTQQDESCSYAPSPAAPSPSTNSSASRFAAAKPCVTHIPRSNDPVGPPRQVEQHTSRSHGAFSIQGRPDTPPHVIDIDDDDEPSPFAYNVQDATRVADHQDQSATLQPQHSEGSRPSQTPPVSVHSFGPAHPASTAQMRCTPAWVRTQQTGPAAGRLFFEPVPAHELAVASKQTAQTAPAPRRRRDHAPQLPANTHTSDFLSQFAYDGDVHASTSLENQDDRGNYHDTDAEDATERWASSSSTLVPSSSPRPEPGTWQPRQSLHSAEPSTAARSPASLYAGSTTSVWPSLAAKYSQTYGDGGGMRALAPAQSATQSYKTSQLRHSAFERTPLPQPHRQRFSRTSPRTFENADGSEAAADEDDSWSTLWIGSGNRLPRPAPTSAASSSHSRAKMGRFEDEDVALSPSRLIVSQLYHSDAAPSGSSRGEAAGKRPHESHQNSRPTASGARIRLSTKFTLPAMPTSVHGSRLAARPTNSSSDSKRRRLSEAAATDGGSVGEERSQRSSRQQRMTFAPTPLERWKAECDGSA